MHISHTATYLQHPEDCARSCARKNRRELADEAQVGIVTVRPLESGQNQPGRATLIVVQRALEEAVEIIDENGGGVVVRLRGRRRVPSTSICSRGLMSQPAGVTVRILRDGCGY